MKEIKPKNNFKDYGFEADFEGGILAVKDGKYFGISKLNESEGWVSNGWGIDGTCLYDHVSHLKPIKKEWYENADNFPCLCIDSYDNPIVIFSKEEYDKCPRLRLATKEEVLALLVKE